MLPHAQTLFASDAEQRWDSEGESRYPIAEPDFRSSALSTKKALSAAAEIGGNVRGTISAGVLGGGGHIIGGAISGAALIGVSLRRLRRAASRSSSGMRSKSTSTVVARISPLAGSHSITSCLGASGGAASSHCESACTCAL